MNTTPKIYSDNFNPISDFVLVETDKERATEKVLPSGIILTIDDRYNPHQTWNTRQDGIVTHLPHKLKKGKEINVSLGDKVYFHHFGCNEENKILVNDKLYYQMRYESLYCKVNGTVEMLNEYNFVEPIMEDEADIKTKSGIWKKAQVEAKLLTAKVCFVSDKIKGEGVVKGDTIYFENHADCEVVVEGKTYYRIKDRSILFVLRDDRIIPLFDNIVLKKDAIKEETVNGIIIPLPVERKECTAKVIAVGKGKEDWKMNCSVGDTVLIHNDSGTEITINEEKLIIMKEENIYGIITV